MKVLPRSDAAATEEDLALVTDLVRMPSVSTREREAVEFLVGAMAARGFRAHVDDVGNAVGEIGDGPVHVALVGHIDTVPGEIPVRREGDHLVGRGAVDAKGPLAAFVAAAAVLGEVLERLRISVVGAVEEEHTTSRGAHAIAQWPAPAHCVIGEPSAWDAITVGYKGRLLARLRLSRPARHGAHDGPTIGEEALALWTRLRDSAASRSPAGRAFDRLDCRLERIVAGDGDGLSVGAELVVGYRLPPGTSPDEVAAELRALTADVEILGEEPPVRVSRATPLARAFQRAIRAAGGEPTFKVKTGTSDMNLLAAAWGCPIVAYGPGDSRYDHTPDERLDLRDYARSIVVLRHALSSLADEAASASEPAGSRIEGP